MYLWCVNVNECHLQSSPQSSPQLPLRPPPRIHSLPLPPLNLCWTTMYPHITTHFNGCPVIQLFSTQALELPPPTHKTIRHHYNLQVTTQNSPVQTRTQRLTDHCFDCFFCFVLSCFCFIYFLLLMFIYFYTMSCFLNNVWWLYAL